MSAGGSNNVNYSMFIVKWVDGETTGLYDSTGFGKGDVFDVIPLVGGQLHQIETEEGKKIAGYATLIKSYIGLTVHGSLNNQQEHQSHEHREFQNIY